MRRERDRLYRRAGAIVIVFLGDPAAYIARVHAVGGKVCHQVGSIAAAQEAARAGVDVIIAQGVEAEATWLGKLRPWR